MKPFTMTIELSKFVNGLTVWGDFSYMISFADCAPWYETVILLEVDYDGVQHFCSCFVEDFEVVHKNFIACGQIEDRDALYQE